MFDLRSASFADATEFITTELAMPRFRAEQVWRWVHKMGITDWDQMNNIPKVLRQTLRERCQLSNLKVAEVQTSVDGTRKMRLVTADGHSIESVLIPDGNKMTQCISSQVGCALDCQFCATGKLGLKRNLVAGEIVDQVYRALALLADVAPGQRITNIVYMGMGEPLHNYDHVMNSFRILIDGLGANLSARRITLSTVGLVSGIRKLGTEEVRPNLAVSLNASNDSTRNAVMPVNKRWNIDELLTALREFPLERRRRITFEYVLLAGVNDSEQNATELAALLRGFRCKLNIIPWNPHPQAPYKRPTPEAIERFQNRMKALGLPCYLRTPRGDDIDAACGQLANRSDDIGNKLVSLRR